jgi:hypothetical protein
MNNTNFTLGPAVIFAIVVGLIVLAMAMSGKNKQRTGMGWWIGLGIILLVTGGFITMNSRRSNFEERHSSRTIASEIRKAVAQGKEALSDGMAELQNGLKEAQDALATAGRATTGKTTVVKVNSTPSPPALPKVPRTTFSTTIELKQHDRSAKKEEVERKLKEQATRFVHQWVAERLPVRYLPYQPLSVNWLQEQGAFPEPVEYSEQDIDRANTPLKDKLYGGSIKLVLSSELQEVLIDQGYTQLQYHLERQSFTAQWIITIVLCGLTAFIGVIAILRGAFRGSSFKIPSTPVTYVLPWLVITCGMKWK